MRSFKKIYDFIFAPAVPRIIRQNIQGQFRVGRWVVVGNDVGIVADRAGEFYKINLVDSVGDNLPNGTVHVHSLQIREAYIDEIPKHRCTREQALKKSYGFAP